MKKTETSDYLKLIASIIVFIIFLGFGLEKLSYNDDDAAAALIVAASMFGMAICSGIENRKMLFSVFFSILGVCLIFLVYILIIAYGRERENSIIISAVALVAYIGFYWWFRKKGKKKE